MLCTVPYLEGKWNISRAVAFKKTQFIHAKQTLKLLIIFLFVLNCKNVNLGPKLLIIHFY